MSRIISWIFASLAALLIIGFAVLDINNLRELNPDAPREQEDASEIDSARRTLVIELGKKLSRPVSIGGMVGQEEAQLRVAGDSKETKKQLESCIHDLRLTLQILNITSVELVDNDKKVKTLVVEPDMLGFPLNQDLAIYEVLDKSLPFLAQPLIASCARHLERCLQAHPNDPALLGYESVFRNEMGQSDTATKERLEKLAKLSEQSDENRELAARLEQALSCTTSNTTPKQAEELADYLSNHLHDDLLRVYILRNLYKDAGLADKAAAVFQTSVKERNEVGSVLIAATLLTIASIAAALHFFFSKNKFFNLPSIQSVACPAPYGWLKPWLILFAALAFNIMGYIALTFFGDFNTQEAPSMMFSYFHPVEASGLVTLEECVLMLPFVCATYLLVGLKKPFTQFVKLRMSTENYSTRELIWIGLQAFIISWIPALVSIILSLVLHYPTEKVSSVSTELLASAATLPSIFLLWFGIGLVAPVTEEIVFRGLLHPALRRHWRMMPALIVGSALFAVIHMEFTSWFLIEKCIFAAANIVALEKTDSILPGIVNHVLSNSMVLIILVGATWFNSH
ncbi:MAG: CPBP family intramembrane metalloprotease [Candidatus Obscuribacterales bacterium]|nr:CPBP family intramembrane metalloprotease [Candidatus Obscuribacterales bacterium]